jgi:hypothetical protein
LRKLVFVDNDCFRGLPRPRVDALVASGHTFRVSAVAFAQLWVQSVREERSKSTRDAQSLLLAAVRKWAPIVDPTQPVAPAGTLAMQAARARAQGQPVASAIRKQIQEHREVWTGLGRCTQRIDERFWRKNGEQFEAWLQGLKTNWLGMCRDDKAILASKPPEVLDALREEIAEWSGDTDENKLLRIQEYLASALRVDTDEVLRPRLDVLIRTVAWRLHHSLKRASSPSKRTNDAADLAQLAHLAFDGSALLTLDTRLLDDVRAAASAQADRVLTLDELLGRAER